MHRSRSIEKLVCSFRTLAAAAIVAMVACIPSIAKAADDDGLAERKARIDQLDDTAKDQLRQKAERFAKLEAAEQERMRALHEQIEAAPDRAQLEATMQRYSEWLATLTPVQRAELADLEPQARVEKIKQLRDKQADQSSKQLSQQDVVAFSKWFVERLVAHKDKLQLSPQVIAALEKPAPHDPMEVMGALLSPWGGRRSESPRFDRPPGDPRSGEQEPGEQKKGERKSGDPKKGERRTDKKDARDGGRGMREYWDQMESIGNLPLSDEEIGDLKRTLSPQARRLLDVANSPEDKKRLMDGWLRQVRWAMMRFNAPRVSREELDRFFNHDLDEDQRQMLRELSPDDMKRQLHGMYYSHQRKKQGGPDWNNGPWGGPEGRPPRRPGQGTGPGQGPPPSIP